MDRSDDAVKLAPGYGSALTKRGIVVADQLDRERAPHLPLPPLDQRRRHQDQDGPGQSAYNQFRQYESRLDRLAQADFIAQHGPAPEPPQDGLGRANLVFKQLNITYPTSLAS